MANLADVAVWYITPIKIHTSVALLLTPMVFLSR